MITYNTPINHTQKPSNPAEFIAKMKGTNDAIGFIATAIKALDAIKDSQTPLTDAKTYSYTDRNLLDNQTFETNLGTINICIYLGESDTNDTLFQERLEISKIELQDVKDAITKPVQAKRIEQEDKLKNMSSNNPFINKINTMFDNLEENANRVGNQIF